MRFTETTLAGAFVIDLELHSDDRGFFARTFCERELTERGLVSSIVQESISFNTLRGTVRGLHFQIAPHAETKTVRCLAGSVFDVIVDLRHDSPTYAKWYAVELSRSNRCALYIPIGFAHGFQTLEKDTELFYQISTAYAPSASRGIRWNDPGLDIDWPMRDGVTVSAKDAELPQLESLEQIADE